MLFSITDTAVEHGLNLSTRRISERNYCVRATIHHIYKATCHIPGSLGVRILYHSEEVSLGCGNGLMLFQVL